MGERAVGTEIGFVTVVLNRFPVDSFSSLGRLRLLIARQLGDTLTDKNRIFEKNNQE